MLGPYWARGKCIGNKHKSQYVAQAQARKHVQTKENYTDKERCVEERIGTKYVTCVEVGNFMEERCCMVKQWHKCRITVESDRVIMGAKVGLSRWMPHE